MKTEVIKMDGEWVVQFNFGVQFFTLRYGGTKTEAIWMERMLKKCFKNYTASVKKKE